MVNKLLRCLGTVHRKHIKFKNFRRKLKSPFMILVPEDNRKQNPNESYSNKYQKHVACSYGYKLVCVNEKI